MDIRIRRELHGTDDYSIWIDMENEHGEAGWMCIRSTYPGNVRCWLPLNSLEEVTEPIMTIHESCF